MGDFFTLSKLFWFLATPSNSLVLITLLGLILAIAGLRRAGLGLAVAGVLGQLVVGFSPLGALLLYPLEERFPQYEPDGRPVAGIILLGGAEVPDVSLSRHIPALSDAGDRIVMFTKLARDYPQARLVFSGGSGELGGAEGSESRVAEMALRDVGVDLSRVTFESRSRNTAENATYSAALLKPEPGARWLLVTSAFHMPRAMGCFRAAGFDVVAAPADFRTPGGRLPLGPFSRVATGFDFAELGLKEWIGLAAYYLTGRIPEILPGPRPG